MKKTVLSFFIAMASVGMLFAQSSLQRNCGTMDNLQRLEQQDPSLSARMQQIENQTSAYVMAHQQNVNSIQSVITIPVVFHVLYNAGSQNISDAQCQAQLNQLNLDFAHLNSDASNAPSAFLGLAANTQIQFCLAQRDPNGNATTGVIHKTTTSNSFSSNDNVKRSSNGGDDAWPAASYLNIWSCNLGNSLLGYAQFPGGSAATDGVVLLYSSIGSMSQPGTATPYHLGRTATHEVGHWLNLRHIWGDSNCGNDQVNDTPTQQTSNFGCPAYPHKTCSNTTSGDMFMNYMDYTDDGCMNLFSAGQSTRMNALFGSGGARISILSSLGCVPPSGGGTCGVPSGQSVSGITTSAATLNWTAVSGAVSYNIQYRVNGGSSWTATTSSSNSKALSGLTSATVYEWQVQTVCSGSSSAFSASGLFTTASSGGGGCTDIYESNNNSNSAKTIPVNTDISALISSNSDVDWFKFTTTSPNTNVMIVLSNLAADYDIRLYNSSKNQLAISQNGGTATETMIRNTVSAGTYYIKIYGYSGAFSAAQCYNLRVNTGSSAFRTMNDQLTANEPIVTSEMSIYPNPASDLVNVMFNAEQNQKATVRIFDMIGRTLRSEEFTTEAGVNKYSINLHDMVKGIYFVELTQSGTKLIKKLVLEK